MTGFTEPAKSCLILIEGGPDPAGSGIYVERATPTAA
jgi:hypothetical protein